MRMIDIIEKKKLGQTLSKAELDFFIEGYTAGTIPDYQAAALCMAIRLMGMDSRETADLTMAMAASGDQSDLRSIPGIKVDKHSTGGVGDKTTLVVGPMVASCGVPVAKMSGRGLGHTGGTLDKLESIPGFRINLPTEDFFHIVNTVGISLIGQTGNLAPADKKLYALRDVTATVDSIPLIASSIMSKKLASGADAIVLDVKCGSGAFMKTEEDAQALAEEMVAIGQHAGRNTIALITNMDRPLGRAIGNSLEVIEAIETLKQNGPTDFTELCVELAANMLLLAKKGYLEDCRAMAQQTLRDGSALRKFREMVSAQGGDPAVTEDYSIFPQASIITELPSPRSGFLSHMETQTCGLAAMVLGAGRATKEDSIDHAAGIVLSVKPGDRVEQGQTLATLYCNSPAAVPQAEQLLLGAFQITDRTADTQPLLYRRVEAK
ncbi:MAG: pyrimidine-nucleoside phosphorylase [Oscillospiraceae bacterium]|nr:pyrimidine-nucleoside phosphorylase [Oscillospiraceae bacterium]